MATLSKEIKDSSLLKLIRRCLQLGIIFSRTEEGTPQEVPLSRLLSNIVLDELDKELESRGYQFVRYTDDCNIHVKSC